MKKLVICLLSLLSIQSSFAQKKSAVISEKEVQRIENILAADSMQGRKVFTAGSEKAANFISDQFKKIGLKTFNNSKSYKQNFSIVNPKILNISASFDGKAADPSNIILISCRRDVNITEKSGFKKVFVKQAATFGKEVGECLKLKENLVVFVDSSLESNFRRLAGREEYLFKTDNSVVFVLCNANADNYSITAKQEITGQQAANVVGVLPGKSRTNEFVIFSAHYDHLGTGKAINGDSVYNGANDDASGVTAVISLAKYYKATNNNERTLIFAAFTAEEIGGYGSQYFSQQIDAAKAVAMFNIEMIGTESKWQKNSAYITGYEKTDMGKILQKNLQGSNFTFYPDPYTEQNLFYRSDNATLAMLGVPAHTISTSKMDNELNYHKLTDEVKTLDISNMTQIIRSVEVSAASIVSGKDTPTRVNQEQLSR